MKLLALLRNLLRKPRPQNEMRALKMELARQSAALEKDVEQLKSSPPLSLEEYRESQQAHGAQLDKILEMLITLRDDVRQHSGSSGPG